MSEIYVEFSKPLDSYCEATSLSFNMEKSRAFGFAGGASSRAQFNDVHFTKKPDSLSDKLWRHCLLGTLITAFSSSQGQLEGISLMFSTIKITQ
jgi:hypothetical protein